MITRLCDKRVFPIGIGTWRLGGGAMLKSTANDKKEVKAISYALDKGINVIDTAELYGKGHAEELVGQAIKGINRERLLIISKVFVHNMGFEGVQMAAKASIERMKCKYIDLYLIHWPTTSGAIRETIMGMEKLMDEGLIRNIGVSNFHIGHLQTAMAAAQKYRIVANEISYSLMHKEDENDVIPFCETQKIKIIAHTPLAQGRAIRMKEVEETAARYKKKPVQVALNYLLKKSLPIPKAVDQGHIRDIIGSVGWQLDDEDYKILSNV